MCKLSIGYVITRIKNPTRICREEIRILPKIQYGRHVSYESAEYMSTKAYHG